MSHDYVKPVSFGTQESNVKDMLVKNTLLEISHMSNCVLEELLVEVREYTGLLYKLSETLSTFDILTYLATVSMSHDLVKPVSFGTQESDVKDMLVNNTLFEISHMSNYVLVDVREYTGLLFKLSETLSTLDILTYLATVSMSHDYVKPVFGYRPIIEQGIQPILDTMTVEIVANDTIADPLSRLHSSMPPTFLTQSRHLIPLVGTEEIFYLYFHINCFRFVILRIKLAVA